MQIIGIISLFISIILFIKSYKKSKNTKEYNVKIEQQNNHLEKKLEQLKSEETNQQIKLNKIKSDIQENYANYEKMKALALESYNDYYTSLNNEYKKNEEEWKEKTLELETKYAEAEQDIKDKLALEERELDKIRATRKAAIEAQLREKEIEEKLDFYCLQISDADKADIARLNAIKPTLNKPRVLAMIIWTSWFQKPLKALSANVLGTSEKTGIYKITNIQTKECYIGQAVNVAKRWSDHAKCGLGIDTPAGNKLYQAMQKYGLHSFSWELLEECSKEELNEKERYYIELYDSVNYGYNILKGVK